MLAMVSYPELLHLTETNKCFTLMRVLMIGGDMPIMNVVGMLAAIRSSERLSQGELAHLLGVSLVSVDRWERGAATPSPAQHQQIIATYERRGGLRGQENKRSPGLFASRGVRRDRKRLPIFESLLPHVAERAEPLAPVLTRLRRGQFFHQRGSNALAELLHDHGTPATTVETPPVVGMSAGKNTYTYDAHTYHTKVPPQGIAELLRHYLPNGGLVLDPFAGSGMTGVASRVVGYDCVLNELSPAACFIADRFNAVVDAELFAAGVATVLRRIAPYRADLYQTHCRECGQRSELHYTVWSYRVLCPHCAHEFTLWDHCREYGERVRDHKIISVFPCPSCTHVLEKSRLRRTIAEPVLVGYTCCGSRQQEATHPPDGDDLLQVYAHEINAPVAEGFFPNTDLPDGVNLRQPKRHGLDRIDRFYTPRNLAALSQLWKAIHHIEDDQLAGQLAFTFTSLYQRVTRLSEFRFWGGSGNIARFNVPYIFNEANVFKTFERKARTIQDHLETTAQSYCGQTLVVQGSATRLDYLPDESVDLIFTDPPFGANINYSEMNIVWEAWLGAFTNARDEAIVNKVQGKGIGEYQELMTASLRECYRVLRPGHWMLLVFMNSSAEVWGALRASIASAGFDLCAANVFDKHHGTFKQFVSNNTAGADLLLHCRKPILSMPQQQRFSVWNTRDSIEAYLKRTDVQSRVNVYLHVERDHELDARTLYSEWMAQAMFDGVEPVDFAQFRELVQAWLRQVSRT
jgi:DNA modification methylase/transcriptional regulator with XRE-family HTH domain